MTQESFITGRHDAQGFGSGSVGCPVLPAEKCQSRPSEQDSCCHPREYRERPSPARPTTQEADRTSRPGERDLLRFPGAFAEPAKERETGFLAMAEVAMGSATDWEKLAGFHEGGTRVGNSETPLQPQSWAADRGYL